MLNMHNNICKKICIRKYHPDRIKWCEKYGNYVKALIFEISNSANVQYIDEIANVLPEYARDNEDW